MIKKIIWFIFGFIFISLGFSFADLWWYTIDNYHVDMTLYENASMDIIETIEVDFSEQRHWIYRDINLSYGKDQQDFISIDSLSVDDWLLAKETRNNKQLSLQIGDINKTITGKKTYTLRYHVNNAIGVYSGWNELYWNVIGQEWNTTIDNSSWTITLPKAYVESTGSTFALRWGYGEKNTESILFKKTSDTVLKWRLATPLQAKQGITIGIKFTPDYFLFPLNYYKYAKTNTPVNENTILNKWFSFFISFIPIFFVTIFITFFAKVITKAKKSVDGARKSDRPVTIYYNPPKNIDPNIAFYFWYNSFENPNVFMALVYHRASKWWIIIKKETLGWIWKWLSTTTYHIIETSNKPQWASEIDKTLLQDFFWTFDSTNDDIMLGMNSHSSIKTLLLDLHDIFEKLGYTQAKKWFWGKLWARELTVIWKDLFEQMRGYKKYLMQVEKPVLEMEIKNNPDFVNKILPWAVLFWVETRLLKIMEEVLKDIDRYKTNDGTYLTAATFVAMNNSFKTYSAPPSSHSSGFGWWGFSWGWGGWGWGGSW